MAYKLKKKLANKNNYGNKRKTSSIKYAVIHYTANDGDTDEGNGNYFSKNIVKASAHYFVDSDSITQTVPDDYVAYSVGGKKYSNCKTTGGGKFYGKCTNSNSISIELCDDKKNGTICPSAATIANAIELTKELMKKYGIPAANVIRHFDVNGKSCPAYWCGTEAKNKKWKTEFWDKLTNQNISTSKPTAGSSSSSVSSGPGKTSSTTEYYKKYTGKSEMIDEVFKAIGVPEKFRNSYMKRKPVASKNGISNYKGSETQNLKLVKLAKAGKLKKV